MTERPDDSPYEGLRTQVRAAGRRPSRQRLTAERTAEIRLRILERAYDSPQVADAIARRMLQRGEL